MTTLGGSYSWNVICDVCGFKFNSKHMRKRWDGLIVCEKDWETRHPLDFYRSRDDTHKLPFIRKEAPIPDDGFLSRAYDPTIAMLEISPYGYGNRFTCLVTGYMDAVRVYLHAGNRTQNMWLVVYNETQSTFRWKKLLLALPETEGWHSFQIMPNIACTADSSYLVYLVPDSAIDLGTVDTVPLLPSAENATLVESLTSLYSNFIYSNMPSAVAADLYLIDIAIRPDATADEETEIGPGGESELPNHILQSGIIAELSGGTILETSIARSMGIKFTAPIEDVLYLSVVTAQGVKFYTTKPTAAEYKFTLWVWDIDDPVNNSFEIASTTQTIEPSETWVNVYFDVPVNLNATSIYVISAQPTVGGTGLTVYDGATYGAPTITPPVGTIVDDQGFTYEGSFIAYTGGDIIPTVSAAAFPFIDLIAVYDPVDFPP